MNREEILHSLASVIDAVIFKPADPISLEIPKQALDSAEVCLSKVEEYFAGEPLSDEAKQILLDAEERCRKQTELFFNRQTEMKFAASKKRPKKGIDQSQYMINNRWPWPSNLDR